MPVRSYAPFQSVEASCVETTMNTESEEEMIGLQSVRETLLSALTTNPLESPVLDDAENHRKVSVEYGALDMSERENAAIAIQMWPVIPSVVPIQRPRAAFGVNGNVRGPVPEMRRESRPWSGISSSDATGGRHTPEGNEICVVTRLRQTFEEAQVPPPTASTGSGEVVPVKSELASKYSVHGSARRTQEERGDLRLL